MSKVFSYYFLFRRFSLRVNALTRDKQRHKPDKQHHILVFVLEFRRECLHLSVDLVVTGNFSVGYSTVHSRPYNLHIITELSKILDVIILGLHDVE